MTTFKAACFRHQGQIVVLIVTRCQPTDEEWAALQLACVEEGADGVACVWNEFGRVKSYGPEAWGPFLRSLTWDFVRANINRKLTIG